MGESLLTGAPQELILNSALVAAVIRVVWAIVSAVLRWLRQFVVCVKQKYSIVLGQHKPEFENGVVFKCLLVRYGTDDYLRHMASDSERFDGRLRNKVLPVSVLRGEGEVAHLELRLPLHKRIGTQFKCFVDVENVAQLDCVREHLTACPQIGELSMSRSQFRNRVYFLLNDFATTPSIDEHQNNMLYPQ